MRTRKTNCSERKNSIGQITVASGGICVGGSDTKRTLQDKLRPLGEKLLMGECLCRWDPQKGQQSF